jgi:acetoin utilization protein AcuB
MLSNVTSGARPVESIMSRTLVTVGLDDTLEHIAFVLERNDIHHVIVTDEAHNVVGVISDRDLLRATSPFLGKLGERRQDLATLKIHAHQVMTRRLLSISETTSIREATDLLLAHGISCLPVLDAAGHALGIVTWRDLLRALRS